ncbi:MULTISPECIES: restriction endonuclease subunit S [Vibrio harveyi group]|uniref:restriction endonuclease subunit S n=1 Tax=Vibrio harveyi group TaxID=717610 RepID=UPI00211B8488|nr:restriction endonuclease subunit S [Vibrio diabolicus]MCQ9247037.1 restriction endonuclease subunit S [Vibrio diabolicus]HCG5275142.1 restriction endonuclease subunit S [Vibrio parahaemolyticus]
MNNVVPEGWRAYNLGELASKIEGGGTPSRTEPKFWNGALPWATVKDLKGIRLQSTLESISLNGLKQSASKLVPANTMILASRMAVGKAVVFDREVAINQDLKAFYPKPILESAYLLQWYLSKAEVIAHMGTGSTVKGIKLDDINSLPIDLPPLPEQKKIAAILTSVDDVIEKTQAQIDKLKDLKTGMMQELLTRGVGVDGKPHTEFKDSPVGKIPKGWDCCLLDKVAKRGSGHTPDKKKPEYWNDGVKWVSLTDSSKLDKLYISDTAKKISQLGIENSSATLHPKGTVVMARDAGVGKSAIMTSSMAVSQHFMAWVCGEKLDNYFLYYLLQHWKPQFEAIAMGSTIKTIGLPYFKKLQIPVPSIEEQRVISGALKSVDNKMFALERKHKQLTNTKKALMQDLLTGKVRVKVDS